MPHHVAPLQTQPLVVLDVETTGFYYDAGDEIIEIAAEKLMDEEVVSTFHALIRPTRSVPPEAVAVHGLDTVYLNAHGREASEVFPGFAEFIVGAVLVGHNIRPVRSPVFGRAFQSPGAASAGEYPPRYA